MPKAKKSAPQLTPEVRYPMDSRKPKRAKPVATPVKAPTLKELGAKIVALTKQMTGYVQGAHVAHMATQQRDAELAAEAARLRMLANMPPRRSDMPVNHGTAWTFSDEQYVRAAVNGFGCELCFIARRLGRTPYAVFCRAQKLGLINEDNVYAIWRTWAAPLIRPAQRTPIFPQSGFMGGYPQA